MLLPAYQRPLVAKLVQRMNEPRNHIQMLIGPRQTGKSTALQQALEAACSVVACSKAYLRVESICATCHR